jgi:hypothetical protein
MGSGIAKQIRVEYPSAYDADVAFSYAGDIGKLGNYSFAEVDNFTIINAYTQYNFNRGANKTDVFEYESFAVILKKLAVKFPSNNFWFPYIGMGLAGGDPRKIIAMLEEFSRSIHGTATLVKYSSS